jgi:hypothetical protein
MDRSIVLQIVNGYLAVTSVFGAMIFFRYLMISPLKYEVLRPAISIFFVFFGTVVLRAPQFIARTIANMGYVVQQPNSTLIIGGIIVEGAFLCVIRVFSPEEWGQWSWIGTLLLSSLVVVASLVMVYLSE